MQTLTAEEWIAFPGLQVLLQIVRWMTLFRYFCTDLTPHSNHSTTVISSDSRIWPQGLDKALTLMLVVKVRAV